MAQFDYSSRQVYTETISAPVRSMLPTWMTRARGRKDDPVSFRTLGKGCSRLREMALRTCVWHVESMEPEALKWLGWHYACQIYDKLKKTSVILFDIFFVLG